MLGKVLSLWMFFIVLPVLKIKKKNSIFSPADIIFFFLPSNSKCLKDCPVLLTSLHNYVPTSQPGNLASVSITFLSQNLMPSQNLFHISRELLISSTYSSLNSSLSLNTFDLIQAFCRNYWTFVPCQSLC